MTHTYFFQFFRSIRSEDIRILENAAFFCTMPRGLGLKKEQCRIRAVLTKIFFRISKPGLLNIVILNALSLFQYSTLLLQP